MNQQSPFKWCLFEADLILLGKVAELFLELGTSFTHKAIRDWEARFAPLIADHL